MHLVTGRRTLVHEHCGFCAGATQASRLPKNGSCIDDRIGRNLSPPLCGRVSGSGSPSLSHFRFATNRDYARPRLGVNDPLSCAFSKQRAGTCSTHSHGFMSLPDVRSKSQEIWSPRGLHRQLLLSHRADPLMRSGTRQAASGECGLHPYGVNVRSRGRRIVTARRSVP